MINREEFKNLVESSIAYSLAGFPYLIIDESDMICPFCHKGMKNSMSRIYCECDPSKDFANLFFMKKGAIKNLNSDLKDMEGKVKEEALSYFKKHFEDNMVPTLIQECKNSISEILSIEWSR